MNSRIVQLRSGKYAVQVLYSYGLYNDAWRTEKEFDHLHEAKHFQAKEYAEEIVRVVS